jgi:hypothetical protein
LQFAAVAGKLFECLKIVLWSTLRHLGSVFFVCRISRNFCPIGGVAFQETDIQVEIEKSEQRPNVNVQIMLIEKEISSIR